MSHQVTISQIRDYSFSHEIAGEHGKGESKSLKVIISQGSISYEVFKNKKLVEDTLMLWKAVRVYNEL